MTSEKIYQNLLNDYGFKYVFGKEKFLVPFLNELLKGKEKIKSAILLNTEFLGKTEDERRAIFDIYCENDKGEKILLEMQNCNQKYFLDRSIYYSSFLIQSQGEKGDWNYCLKKMYIIGILNFVPSEMKESTNCISRTKLIDEETNAVMSGKLNFFFVSLPKFNKTSAELKTAMDYWLYTLINCQPKHKIDEEVLRKNNFFADLLETIKLNKLTKTEMKAYRTSEADYNRMKKYFTGTLEEGRLEGVQQGIQQGIQQGMQRGIQQTALNALKLGYSAEEVSTLTNLSLVELQKLQKQI